MLEATEGGWKPGVQAVVAELLTKGYELRVRTARSAAPEQLESELRREVTDSGAAAGLAVTRQGDSAVAVLCRDGVAACEHLEVEIAEGELARSRLALAVVERLRPLELPGLPPSFPTPKPPPARLPTARSERPLAHPLRAWLGGGAVLSSGMSAPMTWLSGALSVTVASPWGLEMGVAGAPLTGDAETRAGTLSLRPLQAFAFGTFEPFRGRTWEFALGLGGGAVRLQETAAPAQGYDGFSRDVTVGLVSARARLQRRIGPIYWGLAIDPGMLVPAVSVEAGSETVLRLGRPWVALQTTLGVQL